MQSLLEDLEKMAAAVRVLVLDELLKQQVLETLVDHLPVRGGRRLATARVLDADGVGVVTVELEDDDVADGEREVEVVGALQAQAQLDPAFGLGRLLVQVLGHAPDGLGVLFLRCIELVMSKSPRGGFEELRGGLTLRQ